MIDREKYLLTCAAEEATEVAVRCSKAIRFGLSEVQRGQPFSNGERINAEINDFLGVIDMLTEEFGLPFSIQPGLMEAKREKVNQFYEYSAALGEAAPASKESGE